MQLYKMSVTLNFNDGTEEELHHTPEMLTAHSLERLYQIISEYLRITGVTSAIFTIVKA